MQCLLLEKGGLMSGDHEKGWNPYLSGALCGLVIVFSVWLSGNFFGTSTTFVRTVGMLERLVSPERVATMPYFVKELPHIDWQWMFVIGIFRALCYHPNSSAISAGKLCRLCGRNASAPAKASGAWLPLWAAQSPCSGRVWPMADHPAMG
jgi:hypothetical protein